MTLRKEKTFNIVKIRRQLISETVTTQDTDQVYCIDSLHNIKKSIITNVSKEVNVSLNFSVPTEIDTKLSAIKNILLRDNLITFFDVFEYITFFSALNTKSVTAFVNAIVTCKKINDLYMAAILRQLRIDVSKLRSKKGDYVSVLFNKNMSDLKSFHIVHIITEIVNKCPLLMNIMYSISIKDRELMSGEHCDPKVFPKWALVYGILMKHNYHELSFMQHVVTAIMENSLCDQKACKLYILYCFYILRHYSISCSKWDK